MTNILHITLKKYKTCKSDFLVCKYDIYQSEATSQRLLNNPKKKILLKKFLRKLSILPSTTGQVYAAIQN